MEVAIIKRETTGTGKRSFPLITMLITRINSEAYQVIKSYTSRQFDKIQEKTYSIE